MTDQLALTLDTPVQGRSRKRDPESSRIAARNCAAETQRARILSTLAANQWGLTTEELEDELHVVRNTISTRLRVMEKDGLVERFGTRLNRAGNAMTIWFALPRREVDVHVAGDRL